MNTTQSMKPLQIKTEHGPPPSEVRWSPHELNAKYPILNKEQWMFTELVTLQNLHLHAIH